MPSVRCDGDSGTEKLFLHEDAVNRNMDLSSSSSPNEKKRKEMR
jgi:hypothetical protein